VVRVWEHELREPGKVAVRVRRVWEKSAGYPEGDT
jgi:hypothetical protein